MKLPESLSFGYSAYTLPTEGASGVFVDAASGVAGLRERQSGFLVHRPVSHRDGVLQDVAASRYLNQLTEAGVGITLLDGTPDTHPFAFSDKDLETAREWAVSHGVIANLEEYPLKFWDELNTNLPPLIVNLYRSAAFKPQEEISRLLVGVTTGRIALCTTDSDASKATYENVGIPTSSIEVIHNGIDLEKFKPSQENRDAIRHELGIPTDTETVLFVARYSEEKDVPLFLKSARFFLENVSKSAHIIMCGTGLSLQNPASAEEFKEIIGDDPNILSRLHALGARSDFPKMYNAADLVVLTSITESRPLCISEAYASGIRVAVSTNVGDVVDQIGTHGFVTDRNPEEIAKTWGRALQEKDIIGYDINKRDELGQERMVRKYAKVLLSAAR